MLILVPCLVLHGLLFQGHLHLAATRLKILVASVSVCVKGKLHNEENDNFQFFFIALRHINALVHENAVDVL